MEKSEIIKYINEEIIRLKLEYEKIADKNSYFSAIIHGQYEALSNPIEAINE